MAVRTVALLFFVLGAAAVWSITRAPMPGLSPDSASYLGAAQSLARGDGLRIPMAQWFDERDTEPLRHFPPGYPLLIAAPTYLGAPPVQAARVIDTLSGGALLAIAALVVATAGGGASGAAIACAALLVTPAVAEDFFPVLSEPLFLSLLALLLFALQRVPERPLLIGAIAAAGALVRYAGISLPATCVLFYLSSPGPLALRLRRAILVGLPALIAIATWQRITGQFRKYGLFVAGVPEELLRAGRTVAAWLVPTLQPGALRVALTCAALLLIAYLVRSALRARGARLADGALGTLAHAALLFALSYGGVVIAARSFADPDVEFDWRTLSPLILVAELVAAAALAIELRRAQRAQRAALSALAVLWLVGASRDLARLVRKARYLGYSYEAPAWQESQIAAWLRGQGAGLAIYTNNPAALYHLAGRASRFLPKQDDPDTVARFARAFTRTPSAIVEFPNRLDAVVPAEQLAPRVGCGPALRFDRGSVWLSQATVTTK